MSHEKGEIIYLIKIKTWWGWTKQVIECDKGNDMRTIPLTLWSDLYRANHGMNKSDKIVITLK